MQRTMESFIRALRAQDIRVSPAEAIDAHRAAETVGYADRELFRDALVTTLAKTAHEAQTFDSVFETFFRRDEFLKTPEEDADQAMADELPEGEGQGDLAHMLLEHDDAALAQAMELAAERAGVSEIRLSSQRRLLTRRMLDEMGLGGLEQRIADAGRREDEKGKRLAERLAKAREALFAEAGRYVERQHDLYAAESGRKLREDVLSNQKLTAIDEHELATCYLARERIAQFAA